MHHSDHLPTRLLLVLAGTEAASVAAVTLTRALRRADVPALLVTPEDLEAPADLRLAWARNSINFFNRRAWLKRLHPDLVLGADLSRFTRSTLLAARSEGLSSMLWSACGQRLPWWGRLFAPACTANRRAQQRRTGRALSARRDAGTGVPASNDCCCHRWRRRVPRPLL